MSSLLIICVYLSLLPVAHMSNTPRRQLLVMGVSARIQDKLLRAMPGSFTCSAYSTVTWDLGLTSHLKDKSHEQWQTYTINSFFFSILIMGYIM